MRQRADGSRSELEGNRTWGCLVAFMPSLIQVVWRARKAHFWRQHLGRTLGSQGWVPQRGPDKEQEGGCKAGWDPHGRRPESGWEWHQERGGGRHVGGWVEPCRAPLPPPLALQVNLSQPRCKSTANWDSGQTGTAIRTRCVHGVTVAKGSSDLSLHGLMGGGG